MTARPPDKSGRGEVRARLKSKKSLKPSSRSWLERQLNDPYVRAAKQKGYRSRAAFKLMELDSKFRFLKKGARVLDLGAAPGGWTQIAVKRVAESGKVVGGRHSGDGAASRRHFVAGRPA